MGDTRTVDIHIQRLRKKLDWENVIQTVYKYGYRLEIKRWQKQNRPLCRKRNRQ